MLSDRSHFQPRANAISGNRNAAEPKACSRRSETWLPIFPARLIGRAAPAAVSHDGSCTWYDTRDRRQRRPAARHRSPITSLRRRDVDGDMNLIRLANGRRWPERNHYGRNRGGVLERLSDVSSLVENVPGFTSLEVSPWRRAKQAAVRVVNAHRGRARHVPKTEATDWLRGNRYNRTLPVLGRVLLFRHCLGEAPERRSWVSKREDSRAGFARLSFIAFRLSAMLREPCVQASADNSFV